MRKLLLVDDDESNRLTLSVLLEDEGFEVDVASSYSEATRRILAEGARYDAVLLDQHLGDGLGVNLIPLVRERLPSSKVIVISGSISLRDAERSGADSTLPKATPFLEALALINATLVSPSV
jgi:two-component system, response regulator RegA